MASQLRVDKIVPVDGVPTGGGGGIIQCVSTTKTDTFSHNSETPTLITGLTAGTGMELGFDKPLFALAVGISLIIMYDASGIRKAAGVGAASIKQDKEFS